MARSFSAIDTWPLPIAAISDQSFDLTQDPQEEHRRDSLEEIKHLHQQLDREVIKDAHPDDAGIFRWRSLIVCRAVGVPPSDTSIIPAV
jgi:hypothetical protein